MTTLLEQPAARWVLDSVPGARRVIRVQRLSGGLTTRMQLVTVELTGGGRRRYVLRRWTGEPWPGGEVQDGTEAVGREAAVLDGLGRCGLPVPRLVAADAEGTQAGLPAVLMTRLPGRIVLRPDDDDAWVATLADTALALHAAVPATPLPAYETWLRVDVGVPDWTDEPGLWRAALAVLSGAPRAAHVPLIHHDYQPFNVLMSGPRVSGVVDWVWASQGPPDDDVVHCRLNLVLLRDAHLGWRFQRAWEARAGRPVDPWWDVAGLVDYAGGWEQLSLQDQAGRRLRVPPATTMRREVEALLRSVLRRLG